MNMNNIPKKEIKNVKEAYRKLYYKVYTEAKQEDIADPYAEYILDRIVKEKINEAVYKNKEMMNFSDEDTICLQSEFTNLMEKWKKEFEKKDYVLKLECDKGTKSLNKRWWQFWK